MQKLLPLLLFLILSIQLHAQTWQWARAGGGVDDSPLTQAPWESWAKDMTIDKWGNVYTVGYTYNNIQFTGTNTTFPYYGSANAFIVKYDKCGNFDWAIINGNSYGGNNLAITCDTLGNIYVSFNGIADALHPLHIHTHVNTDSLVYTNSAFLIKYDPNGNLIWMVPTPDCAAGSQCLKMRHDGNIVGLFGFGGHAGVTWQSLHIPYVLNNSAAALEFVVLDPQNGNIIKGALLDTLNYTEDYGIQITNFTMDENDNIYLPVQTYALVQNGPFPNASFLGRVVTIPALAETLLKIDKDFNLVKYQFDDNSTVIDDVSYSEGALYSCGQEFSYSNYVTDTIGNVPNISDYRVYRLDTGTLAPVWATSPSFENGSPLETHIVATSKHVYMSGITYGEIIWNNDTSNGYWQYLFQFDKATGHFDKYIVDSGSNSNMSTNLIMADEQENLIIPGQFSTTFTCGPNTLTPWGGSQSPIFFIEKWGVACNDTLNTADNPYPPTNLITTTGGTSSINLQWTDNSQYRISFHIYRSPNGITGWQQVDTALGTQITLVDTGLAIGTWYWYKVVAWNNMGESDPTNIDSAKTLGPVATVSITGPDTLCANRLTGVNYTATVIAGNTYTWSITGGNITSGATTSSATVTWNATGPYKLKITECSGGNCSADSVTMLTIKPVATATINQTICQGQSFNGYTTGGAHIDTFTAVNGCDSIRTINLTVLPVSHSTITHSICAGQSYLGHNQTGTFIDTLNGSNTCDSIRTLNLTVLNPVTTTITKGLCQGFSYGGHSATGTYVDTFAAINTCDSIRTLFLTVSANIQTTITQTVCAGHSFEGYNHTGIFIDTFNAVGGCDSIRTLNLTVLNNITSTIQQTVCAGQQYSGHSTTGTFVDTFTATNTCDSIRTLHLTVLPVSRSTIAQSICAGSSYAGYTAAGTYMDTLHAANGCDSIRTLTLTVLPVATSNLSQSICQGQAYNGHTATGIYIDTFNAANGCDSIRTLNLTVSARITTTITTAICHGETYDSHNTTGVYIDSFTAAGGCDSIRTLQLTVNPVIRDTINHSVCQGDTFNGHSVAGFFSDTLQAATTGCDSVVTLHLTINAPPAVTLYWDTLINTEGFFAYQGDTVYCHEISNVVVMRGGTPYGGIYTGPAIINNIFFADSALIYLGISVDTITYTYTDGNGCIGSASNTVGLYNCLGIQTINTTGSITIYPNPATDQLFIKTENIQPQSISIYDVDGRIIFTQPFSAEININHLNSGVYFMEVNSKEDVAPIIIERKMFVKM